MRSWPLLCNSFSHTAEFRPPYCFETLETRLLLDGQNREHLDPFTQQPTSDSPHPFQAMPNRDLAAAQPSPFAAESGAVPYAPAPSAHGVTSSAQFAPPDIAGASSIFTVNSTEGWLDFNLSDNIVDADPIPRESR